MVYSISIVAGFTILMRSTMCVSSLAGTPESIQWWCPTKNLVSTTSVSFSQWPIDSPLKLRTTTSGSECGRPSMKMVRKLFMKPLTM